MLLTKMSILRIF